MKRIFLIPLFLLSACANTQDGQNPLASILEEMNKGPEVPTVSSTLEESATKAMQEKQFAKAAQFYQQLKDKEPANQKYLLGLAEAKRRSGDVDGALALYKEVIAKDPKSAEALEGKGLCLLAKGETTEAGKAFEEVMALDAGRWKTLNAVGVLFAVKNMPYEANEYYKAALALAPNNTSILNNQGLTYALDRKFDDAIGTLKKALDGMGSDDPNKKQIALNLALIYGIAGKMEEAEETARPHLSGPELYNNLGFYAHLAKNNSLSKAYLNMALTQSNQNYQRAWDNLDLVSGTGGSEIPQKKKKN